MPPHHIGHLHWSAATGDEAAAAHLRQRVQQRGERVTQALARALDDFDPGASRTLHVRQLRLRLEAAWLEQSDDELAAHVLLAVRRAWPRGAPTALSAPPVATCQAPPAPSPPEAAAALQHYLETGMLQPVFTTMAPGERRCGMQKAAALLAGAGDLLRLGGRVADFDLRVEWFRRWLKLWDESDRARWVGRRFAASPSLTDPMSANAQDRLERLLPCLAGEALVDAQAVWMAATSPGPVSFDPDRRADDQANRDNALVLWLGRLSPAGSGAPARHAGG